MKNKLITIETKMKEFPNKLKRQYLDGEKWTSTSHGEVKPFYDIAITLNKNKNFDVENYKKELQHFAQWIDITCENCGEIVDKAIEIGWNYDYDCPAAVCEKCLRKCLGKF